MTVSAFKVLHRSHVPGTAGFDNAGNPKQGKVRVIGEFDITSYTAGGEVIAPSKLGVESLDFGKFWQWENPPSATRIVVLEYDKVGSRLCGWQLLASPALASGDLGIIRYEVVGDAPMRTEGLITDSINSVAGTPLA